MSKIEVNQIDKQNGSTVTIGGSGTNVVLGASGQTVSLATGATQSGFGRTGTVDWQTGAIKTGDFTAVSGEGYFCDTSSTAFTVTLPSSPSAGDIVALKDYKLTWNSNNLTINRNSEPINGGNNTNPVLNTQGGSVLLVYVDGTQGWIPTQDDSSTIRALTPTFTAATGGTETTCGDFKVHTFTSPGTFTVTSAGNAAGSGDTISYVVVGGGGGGSAGPRGSGGGAGGFREGKNAICTHTASPLATTGFTVTAGPTAYPITIGAGGGGGPGGAEAPNNGSSSSGSNTSFSTITSAGGGAGAGVGSTGAAGGSGGGRQSCCAAFAGNTPPVSPPQGQPGGNTGGHPGGTPIPAGAGGGGATASTGTNETDGGAGGPTGINFSTTVFAGGGGGGGAGATIPTSPRSPLNGGVGGAGGGGSGAGGSPAPTPSPNAGAGTANTGGGGGGAGRQTSVKNNNGGAGGSGIVILRYKFQ